MTLYLASGLVPISLNATHPLDTPKPIGLIAALTKGAGVLPLYLLEVLVPDKGDDRSLLVGDANSPAAIRFLLNDVACPVVVGVGVAGYENPGIHVSDLSWSCASLSRHDWMTG